MMPINQAVRVLFLGYGCAASELAALADSSTEIPLVVLYRTNGSVVQSPPLLELLALTKLRR
jgi:hypothetical protein